MDRRAKLLSGLEMSTAVGAEIGALCRPVVSRSDGMIYYIDHASTEDLRQKYRNDPNVDIDALVEVDAVWGKQSLSDALDGKRVDYVIASHVVEHVPDLIGWFTEIAAVLKQDGQLRLAVPDKRFTFDVMREESRLSDVLNAYLVGARIPQPQAILDHMLNVRHDVSAADIWAGSRSGGRQAHTLADAIGLAQDAFLNGAYHDVHCWVFTPKSFARICRQLVEHGLLHSACAQFFDTARNELEFHVHMQPCADAAYAAMTWQRMEDAVAPRRPHITQPSSWFQTSPGSMRMRFYSMARRIRHLRPRKRK